MPEFTIESTRAARAVGRARGKSVAIPVATLAGGCTDAFAPLELLLAAIAAGVLGGAELAAEALSFHLAAVEVRVRGTHLADVPPTLFVEYDLGIVTDEPDGRLLQFHERVRQSDSVQRLGAATSGLSGRLRRVTA